MNRSYSKIRHIQEANQRLENRLFKQVITESYDEESYAEVRELDDWIEANENYLYSYYLEEKVKELFNLRGEVTSDVSEEEDNGGNEYGENWNKKLITIKNNGDVLVKVWVNNDDMYDYGKNVTEFNKRFYFNKYAL